MILCLSILYSGSICSSVLHAPYTFGRTHFVVGAPIDPVTRTHEPPVAHDEATRAYFSPDDDLQRLLCERIAHENEAIDIAIFSFTDKRIANALMQAHKRGIAIRIVTDKSALHDRFSKVPLLLESGIPVYVYDVHYKKGPATLSNLMHNKFVLFKRNKQYRTCVWTGSFNFTRSAALSNQENVVESESFVLSMQFSDQFERLIARCKRVQT